MENCTQCESGNIEVTADLVRVTYECQDCGNTYKGL